MAMEDAARKAALERSMPAEAEAPAAPGGQEIPVEQVMAALEALRSQIPPEKMETFDQGVKLLGDALGAGPAAAEAAPTAVPPQQA